MKLTTSLVIILSLSLLLARGSAIAGNSSPILSVSPKVCVIGEEKQVCELTLHFEWKLAQEQDICLFENDKQVQCWQKTSQAKLSHKAYVQVETVYSLINRQTGNKLAQTKVEIQSSHLKTQRRRLRSPWSFF
jgi:hypothetical protein